MILRQSFKLPHIQSLIFYRFSTFRREKTYHQKNNERKKPANKQALDAVKFNQQNKNSIEQINKHFQGIRMNTSYAKFYNEDSFQKATNFTGRKIADLPFQYSQLKKTNQKQRMSKLASHILNKVDREQLIKKLKELSSNYFTDLIKNERTVKIQPNFQREARRTIASLNKDNYKFNLAKKNQNFILQILSVQLFKGIQVTRNNNYSIDSYQIINKNQYTDYKLWEKGSYKIPQPQWFSMENFVMRIITQVESPWNIEITRPSTETIKTQNKSHIIIFEMDLKKPPRFSNFRLTPIQYLKSYSPKLENLTITNVDNRNQYMAFTHEEKQKKQSLINKLV